MAYFTSADLASAGYTSGSPCDFVAAPQNNGMGFGITDVLSGVGSVVGKIFGGGGSSGNSDQAQIAALIAQQQQAAQQSQTTMLTIGMVGLAGVAALIYMGQRRKNNPHRSRKFRLWRP